MRIALLACGLLLLASCTDDRRTAAPAADSVAAPLPGDTTQPRDTTEHRGDSVMARDTASGI